MSENLTPYERINALQNGLLNMIEGSEIYYIIFALDHFGVLRTTEIQDKTTHFTSKVLMDRLRKLSDGGVVHKKIIPAVPTRVEYRLTDFGRTLLPVAERVLEWLETDGQKHYDEKKEEKEKKKQQKAQNKD